VGSDIPPLIWILEHTSEFGLAIFYHDSNALAHRLAVRFLFESSDALSEDPKFEFEPFTAKSSRNDYEVRHLFNVPSYIDINDQRFLGL
jgi:hypothetical protein